MGFTYNRIKVFLGVLASISMIAFGAFCHGSKKGKGYDRPDQLVAGWNKDLEIEGVDFDVYVPAGHEIFSGVVLVLPGWNFSRTSWVENSSLVEKSQESGMIIVLPEMGKTLYETSFFPETKMRWNQYPGSMFIKEIFLPVMQKKYHLFLPECQNFILGLSTGGRGVAMTILENKGLFVKGAALSGDFAQHFMPKDRIMTNIYGSSALFPERWRLRDNPFDRAEEFTVPLYLAHGVEDKVVPESQSAMFYERLKKIGKEVYYEKIDGAGHDYTFWDGRLNDVFDFFLGKYPG